jgi:hypothetical protein
MCDVLLDPPALPGDHERFAALLRHLARFLLAARETRRAHADCGGCNLCDLAGPGPCWGVKVLYDLLNSEAPPSAWAPRLRARVAADLAAWDARRLAAEADAPLVVVEGGGA